MSPYQMFDHLPEAILVMDDHQEIIYFNHQSSMYFKLSPRLFKSKHELNLIFKCPEFDMAQWLKSAQATHDTQTSPEFKLQLNHEPETTYFAAVKIIPQGQTYILVFMDRTVETVLHSKYRDQLEELKKAHNQVLQADKLNILGEITANISHEINNPLAIAAGHAEIIQAYLQSPNISAKAEELSKANDAVMEALERVNHIIKNMKDFLHQSQDQKEYCDLEAVVDAAMEWIGPTAKGYNVQINKVMRSQKTAVLANKVKLEQVIINLVKNSLDALHTAKMENGIIDLIITKSKQENQILVDVIDNGPGIPAQIKDDLFKPFTSTKEAGEGTGLGLSLCAKIIETHQGKLEHVDTKSGCHFRFYLPMIELSSYTRNDRSLSGSKKEKRILVLDNEVQILNVMNSFISEAGLVFIGSSQPEDALAFMDKLHIDLIITDFSMPTMNGDKFSQLARAAGYQGSILYMTSARFIEQYNKDKKDLQIDGIIIKPFNRQEVMSTIHHALKGAAA